MHHICVLRERAAEGSDEFCPWMVLFKIMESAPACRAFAQNAHQRGQEKSRKLSEHKTESIWNIIILIVTSTTEFRYILFCKVYYGPCWSRPRALQKIKTCRGSLIQTLHLKPTKAYQNLPRLRPHSPRLGSCSASLLPQLFLAFSSAPSLASWVSFLPHRPLSFALAVLLRHPQS